MSITVAGITVDSYVYDKDGNEVLFDSLTPEQKKKAATKLVTEFVSWCYPGSVIFHTTPPATEEAEEEAAAESSA